MQTRGGGNISISQFHSLSSSQEATREIWEPSEFTFYITIVEVARLMLTKCSENAEFICPAHMRVQSKYNRATYSIRSYNPAKN